MAAARRIPLVLPVVLWASAGLNMLWVDWVFLGEDVVFHLVLSVVMSVLVALGYGIVASLARLRVRSQADASRPNG